MIIDYKEVLRCDKDFLISEIKKYRHTDPAQYARAMKELGELIQDARKCGLTLADLIKPICLN